MEKEAKEKPGPSRSRSRAPFRFPRGPSRRHAGPGPCANFLHPVGPARSGLFGGGKSVWGQAGAGGDGRPRDHTPLT